MVQNALASLRSAWKTWLWQRMFDTCVFILLPPGWMDGWMAVLEVCFQHIHNEEWEYSV